MQHAQLGFVSADLASGDHDSERRSGSTMLSLRLHAARVITVTGGPLKPPAPPPEPEGDLVSCDNLPSGPHDEELDRCPKCGEYWH
jgi:hypothetical protein